MTLQQTARNAYVEGSVQTASPERLLLMLLDRLVLDVERGLKAQAEKAFPQAGKDLVHAQAIVTHLMSTFQPDGLKGGPELMSLYMYLNRRLIQANVRRDPKAGKESLWLAKNINDLWKRVAVAAAAEGKANEGRK